ncbi:sigma-54-dependent transcriptional regulator [Psychrobacter aestuarii]|uniref:Sigma-54-dependent Fis family transcriptional regulator n=1 Tax=Psychrobacter aestuarii TaxID=556327 RepID=A0ABN0VN04_9GAMM|nr:sigma-54 dependent transcriptional regulator [Psychrobacter aestuarii]
MTATALVVDDEVDLCRLMQITLTKMGIKSDVAYTLTQAREYLEDKSYDFCLTDLKLPDGSGLELVQQISGSRTPVAVITAHGSMDLAIEALKLGAFDFVNKPLELPRLRQLVENALKVAAQATAETAPNTRTPEQVLLDERLIGQSAVMVQLKTTILKLARSQAPVFLSGASGTGKEVVARLIHDLSPRREHSFVPVNCGAIPSELMESEFFGHKKGSFTGAVTDKQGLFQQANGGTLFLDEVADLPLAMQVKLLRAIQEKSVRAIGDTKEVAVDIRILSATHKDLAQLVQVGAFRQDLYYRINVIELSLPALHARQEDIPALAQHFLALIAKEWQLESLFTLTPAAYQRLRQHEFAGNVRELRNILERAITLAEDSEIDVSHLGLSTPVAPERNNTADMTEATEATETARSVPFEEPVLAVTGKHAVSAAVNLHPYRTNSQPYPSAISSLAHPPLHAPASEASYNDDDAASESASSTTELPQKGLEAYLQEQEKRLIITALKQTDWNKTQAAELLGTTFRSLRYRMKKLNIDDGRYDD